MLLLLGATSSLALAVQAWRSTRLEMQARAVELERAQLLAERILRTAAASRDVLTRVPASRRVVLGDGGVEIDASVAWLEPVDAADDLVVTDRLTRAARAEFAAGDKDAASREYAELVRQPLPSGERLRALTAAAWHYARVGDAEHLRAVTKELDTLLAGLAPARLAEPRVATAVAAAARLHAEPPAWAETLVPLLPRVEHAGLPRALQKADAGAAVTARRSWLRTVRDEWRALRTDARDGLAAVGDDALLWWLPREDGRRDAARLSVGEWLEAVRAAGREGVVPEWPWQLELDVGEAGDTFAGVPRVRGLRRASRPWFADRPWLWPAFTFALLAAFGVAAAQHFRASRREAEAVRTQAEFLTTVTHELKTPLASIRLIGEMLAEGRARGREADYYRMLSSEAGRLSMLIENVLDLGRLERGERAYDLRSVDLAEVVGETFALFAPVAERDGLHAVWRDELGGVANVPLDRLAFVQALVCVLDNARKYGAVGGSVEVVARRAGAVCEVDVRDRGAGVPESERERIFARFARGEAHAQGSTPGVGIGLYLARTIARRLGGDLVCAAPRDGGPGACFTFTLAGGSAP